MPPKKKNKGRHAAADDDSVPEPISSDGWTDEQETTLFKAISVYRLKPAGKWLRDQKLVSRLANGNVI